MDFVSVKVDGWKRKTKEKKNHKPCKQDTGDLETELFYIGLVFLAVCIAGGAAYGFILRNHLPRVPCMMYALTGMYCPGCGGTRALAALLRGKIVLSLWYHPLILYSAVIGGGFMLTQGLHRLGVRQIKGWKFHGWFLYGAVIIIFINFILKNVLLLAADIAM